MCEGEFGSLGARGSAHCPTLREANKQSALSYSTVYKVLWNTYPIKLRSQSSGHPPGGPCASSIQSDDCTVSYSRPFCQPCSVSGSLWAEFRITRRVGIYLHPPRYSTSIFFYFHPCRTKKGFRTVSGVLPGSFLSQLSDILQPFHASMVHSEYGYAFFLLDLRI
jgi:hypothetical protein